MASDGGAVVDRHSVTLTSASATEKEKDSEWTCAPPFSNTNISECDFIIFCHTLIRWYRHSVTLTSASATFRVSYFCFVLLGPPFSNTNISECDCHRRIYDRKGNTRHSVTLTSASATGTGYLLALMQLTRHSVTLTSASATSAGGFIE